MAAATVRAYEFNGAAGATQTSIDSGASGTAPNFGTSDAVAATGTVSVPLTTGTNYSWNKNWGLFVTVAGTTNISNRRIAAASGFTAGTILFFKDGSGVYTQGAAISGSGSNGPATPATYTNMTTGNQTWDTSSVASSGTGLNGHYVNVAFGVDSTFAGSAGSFSLPTINLVYDEA